MPTEGQLRNDAQEGGALSGSAGQAKDDARPTSAGTPDQSGGEIAATGTGHA